VQKQKMNVYTVMLIVSFICLLTACLFLYLELRRWGSFPWWDVSKAAPATQAFHTVPAVEDIAPPIWRA
jgi:hypothetical protein